MDENINLCEILKGHEGETFYSPLYGEVILLDSSYSKSYSIRIEEPKGKRRALLTSNGHYTEQDKGEIMLFPSKDQRDWKKWDKEHNHKTPKTWSDIKSCNVEVWYHISYMDYGPIEPIVRSALALLKIHQLIEVGYGGNVTGEEWYSSNPKWIIAEYVKEEFRAVCVRNQQHKSHIAFHTKEQVEEFLSYPENIQLLRDYFMIS